MTYEVQATIPYFNGLPRDCATNVWHFQIAGSDPDLTSQTALITALRNFYFHVYGDASTIASYADPASARMKLYNLLDTPPRSPLLDTTGSFAATKDTNTTLPPEISVCLSISGVGVGGTPLASQRGRVYLGCLSDNVVNEGTITSFPTVAQVFRAYVVSAAEDLITELSTTAWRWVVYSRKTDSAFQVVKGYVDDAFDIQRRRGQDPVIRTVFPS